MSVAQPLGNSAAFDDVARAEAHAFATAAPLLADLRDKAALLQLNGVNARLAASADVQARRVLVEADRELAAAKARVYLRLDVRALDATGSVPVGPSLARPDSCRGRLRFFVDGGDKERPVGSIATGAVPRASSLPIVAIRNGTQRARRRRSAAGSGGSRSRADLKGARGRRRRAGSGR
jgi:hypothetical protein